MRVQRDSAHQFIDRKTSDMIGNPNSTAADGGAIYHDKGGHAQPSSIGIRIVKQQRGGEMKTTESNANIRPDSDSAPQTMQIIE